MFRCHKLDLFFFGLDKFICDSLLPICVSLLATLEPGISPCQTGALSAATISRLSVFVLPYTPPPLSMPQLKLLHSSQSSFQDNKFDARRSSLCAGVFTQISRYQGSCRMGDSVYEYKDQSYEYQQTGTGFYTSCTLWSLILRSFLFF